MPHKRLPAHPNLRHLKQQAADLRAAHRNGNPDAIRRISEFHPRFGDAPQNAIASATIAQSDALLTIAREYGFASWPKIKQHVEGLEAVDRRVASLRESFAQGDGATRRRLLKPAHDARRFERFDPDAESISEADARLLIANEEGYAFWQKYESYLHLDPSVQSVIAAVRTGDRERLSEILRDDPGAANPRWVEGYTPPQLVPNDSIPLFCISERWDKPPYNTRGNEYDLVCDLVRAGAEVDFQCGMSLNAAISANLPRAVEAFLDCGAAIDGPDHDGSPLVYAVQFGHWECAQLLARRGAKTDLRLAAGLGRLDEVKSWFNDDGSLKRGAGEWVDPYPLERKLHGQSPYRCERTRANILNQSLYFACTHGRLEIAEFLISQGAEVEVIVPGLDSRMTILHGLALMDAEGWPGPATLEQVARLLLDHGADLTRRDEIYHATPLDWARHNKNQRGVELLRTLGAVE
jgi:hypothetical protein